MKKNIFYFYEMIAGEEGKRFVSERPEHTNNNINIALKVMGFILDDFKMQVLVMKLKPEVPDMELTEISEKLNKPYAEVRKAYSIAFRIIMHPSRRRLLKEILLTTAFTRGE